MNPCKYISQEKKTYKIEHETDRIKLAWKYFMHCLNVIQMEISSVCGCQSIRRNFRITHEVLGTCLQKHPYLIELLLYFWCCCCCCYCFCSMKVIIRHAQKRSSRNVNGKETFSNDIKYTCIGVSVYGYHLKCFMFF